MSLNNALEGYEYQDLLSAYFIINEILIENDSNFIIDAKEFENDKFDDLTVINQTKTCKKQIKYSNPQTSHILKKKDLSADSSHQLAIDDLFSSWLQIPDKENCEIRLCLAWDEPIDELKEILYEVNNIPYSFYSTFTKIFKINSEILWPNNEEPLFSWKRFKLKCKEINDFVHTNDTKISDNNALILWEEITP